jgi:hypothetical protein
MNIPSGVIRKDYPDIIYDQTSLGDEAEPAVLEMIPHATILEKVQFGLPEMKEQLPEIYMWIDYNGTQAPKSTVQSQQGDAINSLRNAQFSQKSDFQYMVPVFFSAFPFNSTTGTKRYHAMRFNSTVDCEYVSKDAFPTECPGEKPYSTSIKMRNETTSSELRVCVPGKWGTFPWTVSRNKQDIEEEAYLQLSSDTDEDSSSTIHCSASTTRGYFEIGNYRTGGAYGPLLEHWPSPEEMKEFNDEVTYCTNGDANSCAGSITYVPSEW